ncbi:MAG TPA: hypothetical protein VF021_04140 [Longimicrobiales bacterium]
MNGSQPRSIVPVVIGIALTAALLLGLVLVTSKRNAEENAVPSLTVLAPLPQSTTDSPLVVRFRSAQPLQLGTSGWGYQQLHLHAWLNDVQYMPAASDVRRLADGSYQWSLPAVPRGPVTLRLGWADARHRPLAAGASQDITATLQ